MSEANALPLPEQPETFWAYLAAFIDGEGSVTMCQNGPRLIITNTHLETLEWIKGSLNAGYLGRLKGGYGQTKPCYSLSFGSNGIRMILPRTILYMRIKKQKAEILMEYMSTVVPRGGNYHTNFDELRTQVRSRMAGV